MQPTFVLFSLAFLFLRVSCSNIAPIFTRQSSADGLGLDNIPDACQTACSPIESTVNTCQELSCLCNNDAAKQIADCANCLVAVAGDSASSLQAQEQSIIDQFTNACDTSGEPVSSIQVSSVAPSLSPSDSGSGSETTTATSAGSSSSGTSPAASASNSSTRATISPHASVGVGVAVIAVLVTLLVSV